MKFLEVSQVWFIFFIFNVSVVVLCHVFFKLFLHCWIYPVRAQKKLRENGFCGPRPSFPLGNHKEMKKLKSVLMVDNNKSSTIINHDIHSIALPHFARWQQEYGKVFVYWLGIEPFLYVSDPEFLSVMSKGVSGKSWGKPNVFKKDREPMFGTGLVMVEGDEWSQHRHIISPGFSYLNLMAMTNIMKESTSKMLDRWDIQINSGNPEFDMESEIIGLAGEIIAKISFGVTEENKTQVLKDLMKAVLFTLFDSNRKVGVPFNNILSFKQTVKAKKLGRKIDGFLLPLINEGKRSLAKRDHDQSHDLLGMLLKADHKGTYSVKELVDECKTFFFGGHETTALSLTWTFLLLAIYPEWQETIREEIRQVIGDSKIEFNKLAGLKKMGWVMNEVLRLYPPAPNLQRQARRDIDVNGRVIPNGTNIWIDVVAMHHDVELWGDDVNEFKPERFSGGCKNKMGFMPFGFGGRMCIGRNLSIMEYKIIVTLVLSRFELSVSPSYRHLPTYMLTLRPGNGLPLIVRPL